LPKTTTSGAEEGVGVTLVVGDADFVGDFVGTGTGALDLVVFVGDGLVGFGVADGLLLVALGVALPEAVTVVDVEGVDVDDGVWDASEELLLLLNAGIMINAAITKKIAARITLAGCIPHASHRLLLIVSLPPHCAEYAPDWPAQPAGRQGSRVRTAGRKQHD
jgi:hypothetical protein